MKKQIKPSLLRIVSIALLLFGYQLVLAQSLKQPPIQALTTQKQSILVVGDSLSAAYGLQESSGWVDLLTSKISTSHSHWKVNNASISGETTAGGANRIVKLLKQYQPDIVLIELGGNDGLRGFPINVTYKNLEKIIQHSQQINAKVIIAGIHLPPNYGKKYEELFYKNYTTLAEKYSLTLIPFLLEGIGEKPELMQADGIHPKETAQGMILDNVWPFLESLL